MSAGGESEQRTERGSLPDRDMSARQLNRLAKAKGLDPLLGGGLNVESEESDGLEDSAEEGSDFGRGAVVSASVSNGRVVQTMIIACGRAPGSNFPIVSAVVRVRRLQPRGLCVCVFASVLRNHGGCSRIYTHLLVKAVDPRLPL